MPAHQPREWLPRLPWLVLIVLLYLAFWTLQCAMLTD